MHIKYLKLDKMQIIANAVFMKQVTMRPGEDI